MSAPLLELEDVSRTYTLPGGSERHAVRHASFSVEPGQVLSIVGRSGSGKSTLLHLAAGIDLPTTGAVHFDGRELTGLSEAERCRLRRDEVGLVFQFFHLLPQLTVAENVAVPGLLAGEGLRGPTGERVDELLGRVGLADRAGDEAERLSGGEMQRVALCRALLRKPRLLLADEPTGNLDDRTGAAVLELMLELAREERSAVVYVTHSREVAAASGSTLEMTDGVLGEAGA